MTDPIAEEAFAQGKLDAANRLLVGKRVYRKLRAAHGWVNWYINRGRLPLNPTKKELRALSWRRVK